MAITTAEFHELVQTEQAAHRAEVIWHLQKDLSIMIAKLEAYRNQVPGPIFAEAAARYLLPSQEYRITRIRK
jgi:hypothetical protein